MSVCSFISCLNISKSSSANKNATNTSNTNKSPITFNTATDSTKSNKNTNNTTLNNNEAIQFSNNIIITNATDINENQSNDINLLNSNNNNNNNFNNHVTTNTTYSMASSSSSSSSTSVTCSTSNLNSVNEKQVLTLLATSPLSNLNKSLNYQDHNYGVLMLKSASNFAESTDPASSCIATTSAPISHPTSLTLPTTSATGASGNIISLVSLGSPQKSAKLFPWSSNPNGSTSMVNTMNSPTKSTASSPGGESSLVLAPLSPLNNNSSNSSNATNPIAITTNNKQILRPQVMLGNNSINHRINFTHLNRPLTDSIQVVLKKPSNQTIVIVSKPPNTSQPSNSTSIQTQQYNEQLPSSKLTSFEANANSNLKINNLLMSINTNTNANTNTNKNNLTNPYLSQMKACSSTDEFLTLSYNDINNYNELNISNNLTNRSSTTATTTTTTTTTASTATVVNANSLPLINRLFDASGSNIYKPNENLINTDFNNSLLSAKPIKLIPIKKISHMKLATSATTRSPITTSLTSTNNNIIKEEKFFKSIDEASFELISNNTTSFSQPKEIDDTKCNLLDSLSIIATSLPINELNSDNFKHEPTNSAASDVAAVKQETTRNNNFHIKSKNIKTTNKLSQKGGDITRCICEMDHDDGFMICCDKCLVWQHIVCMQVNRKKIPDKFYCEMCKPRSVNSVRAKIKQAIFCKNLEKKKHEQNTTTTSNNETNKTTSNNKTIIYDEDDYEEYTSEEDEADEEAQYDDDQYEENLEDNDYNKNNNDHNQISSNHIDNQTQDSYDHYNIKNNMDETETENEQPMTPNLIISSPINLIETSNKAATNLKNVSNIDIYDNEDDDLNKFKDSELDGHNDRLIDENNNNNNNNNNISKKNYSTSLNDSVYCSLLCSSTISSSSTPSKVINSTSNNNKKVKKVIATSNPTTTGNKSKKTNDDKENGNRINKSKLKKSSKENLNNTSKNKPNEENKMRSNTEAKFSPINDNESTSSSSASTAAIPSKPSGTSRKPSCSSLSEELNFKKVKRNQYSSRFLEIQMKLSEQSNSTASSYSSSNSSGSNAIQHSNKSTVSSLLAASELSKQQRLNVAASSINGSVVNLESNKIQVNKRGSLKDIVKSDCIKLIKLNGNVSSTNNNLNNLSKDENEKKPALPTASSVLTCRIKSSQNIEENQVIGEYIGKVMVIDELEKDLTKNPFVAFYKLDLNEKNPSNNEVNEENKLVDLCIDSSSIGSITRFIRKSCSANCKLKHIVDINGHIHFLIVSVTHINKANEITLPFDADIYFSNNNNKNNLLADNLTEHVDLNYCLCSCQNEKCLLRDAITKHVSGQTDVHPSNEIKTKKEPIYSGKRKRENSADNMSPKSSLINSNNSVSVNNTTQKLKEDKSHTRKNSAIKTTNAISNEITLKENIDNNETQESTKHLAGHNSTKKRNNSGATNTSPASRKYNQSKSLNEETDDVKSLSREDRKLISYVKVIEKLEKQGKRKKELKQQRAAAAAAAAAAATQSVDSKESTDVKQEFVDLIQTESKLKSTNDQLISKPLVENLNNQQSQLKPFQDNKTSLLRSMEQVIDQEIADINEKGALNRNRTSMLNGINQSEATNHCELDKPLVKSPDYSFVNLSIRPRQTLNLIQRNLSTPAAYPISSYELTNQSNDFKLNVSNSTQPSNDSTTTISTSTSINNNLPLFNPKKYWLKCSTASVEPSHDQAPTSSVVLLSPVTPLKKRRHAFNDEHSNSSQNNDEIAIKEEPITEDHEEKLFNTNMNINNLETNEMQMEVNNIPFMPYQYFPTLQQTTYQDFSIDQPVMNFHHEQQLDPLVAVSLSLDESNLKPIAYQLQHQQTLSIFPVETSISQQVSPSISLHDDQAALEAQKRKRVSLAEYRQRKETIMSSPSSSQTSLNNKCSSELLKNSDLSIDHQMNSCECSNTELDNSENNSCDLFIKKEEEKQNDFELDNISSGKSKINKLLTEIMANNKKQATNTLSFNCFESKAAFTSKTISNVELSSTLNSIHKADFETASVAVNSKQQELKLNGVACSKMDHEKSDISDPILLKPVSQITSNLILAENIKDQPSSVQQQQLPTKQEKQDETEEGEYPSDEEENENEDDKIMNMLDIKTNDSASRNGVDYDDFEFDSRIDEKSSSYSNLLSKQVSSSLIGSSKKDHQNKKYKNEYSTSTNSTNINTNTNTTTATLTNDSILSSHRRRRSISVASSIGSVHSISFDSSSIKSSASERQHHLNRSSMRTIHQKHRHRHKTRRSQSIGNRSMHSGGCSISSRSVSATSVSEIMDLMIMENSSSKKKEEKHSVSNGASNRKKYEEEEDYRRQQSAKQQNYSRNSSLSNYYSNNNNNFNYSSSNNSQQNSSRKRSKSRSNNKHASSSSSSSIPVSSSRMARTQANSYFRGKYENYKFSERNTSSEMRGHLHKKPRMSTSPTGGYDNTNVNESQSYSSSSNSNHRNSSDLYSNLYSSSSASLVDNNKNRRDYHTNNSGYINSNYSKDYKEEDSSGKYRRYFSTNSQSSLTITREYDLSERATLNEFISSEATNDSDSELKKNNKSIENSDGPSEAAESVEPLLSHELGNGILNVSASSSSAVSTSNTENNMDSLDGGNHQRDSYRVQTKTNRSSSSSKEYHRSRSSSRYQQSSSSNQRIPFSSIAYSVASSATGSKRRQSSLSRERDVVSSYNSGESFKSSLNHWSSSSKMYYNSSKPNTYHHYNNHHHNNHHHHHHHHHHQNRSIINEDYYNFQKRQSAASNSSYRIGSSSKQSDLSTYQRQNKSSDSYYRNKKESSSSSSSSSSNKYDLRYQLDKVHKKQNGSTEPTSSTTSSSSSTSSLASSSSLLKIQSAVSLASATSLNDNNKKEQILPSTSAKY